MEFCQIYVVTSKLQLLKSNICRCPDPEYARKMIVAIDDVRVGGDSVGGVVTCIVRNLPEDLVHQFLTNSKLNWLRQLYQYLQPRALSFVICTRGLSACISLDIESFCYELVGSGYVFIPNRTNRCLFG
ncbi:chorismate synthase 1, chloroplastic [Artemisia annua]|uniref:chorismate synthase n=1 Tax=Artemisia annua TaxID=35608 RepID=A0A2U1Q8H1_ARTAN|nr:chorismate synthase 1, chloroplastic [Artemisia annua]